MIACSGSDTFGEMTEPAKHILVSVLDWGLGHATRSVPVIQSLIARGCKVSLAGHGDSLLLLKMEFPQLQTYEITSYRVAYSASIPFMTKIFMQLPKFLLAIRREHRQIEKLCLDKSIDAIISDNRYGCWSNSIPSILITHQLNLILPSSFRWLSGLINFFNHKLIKKFDVCWVPDYSDNRVTGTLSQSGNLRVRFIGMLSRMKPEKIDLEADTILAILSGPEPQRQILEKILIKEMSGRQERCTLVRGLPNDETTIQGGQTIYNHLNGDQLSKLIQKSSTVITRSGYSSIMDLTMINAKRVILIPTPGQTEQEYLAQELDRRKVALYQAQANVDLKGAISRLNEYRGFIKSASGSNLLAEAIENMLKMEKD